MRVFLCFLCLSLPAFSAQEVYTFVQKVKEERNKITWTLNAKPEQLSIEGVDKDSKTVITGSPTYRFTTFMYESPTTSYVIETSGSVLSVRGTTESGVRKAKSYNIGSEPWVQQFWFGLLPFLKSNDSSFRFSIINPKDFTRVRMIAHKERIVPLTIEGKDVPALQVKITLQGFKSMFWTGHVWYDPQTYTFLKYEANSGPNTPLMTVIHKQ